MWINKTQRELTNERRLRLAGKILGVVAVASLLNIFGLPHNGFHVSIGLRLLALLAAVVVILAWQRRLHWRRLQSSVCVCEECGVVNANKDQALCACGGTFRPLHEMKWFEMPPSEKFPCPAPETQAPLRPAHQV